MPLSSAMQMAAGGAAAAPAITPGDLPSLLRWHDAGLDTYVDFEATTPTTDGETAIWWLDQAPTTNHLFSNSASSLTYYATACNGLPAVGGDGTKSISWESAFNLTAFHMFILINVNVGMAWDFVAGGSTTHFQIAGSTTMRIRDESGDQQDTQFDVAIVPGTWQILEISYTTPTLTVTLDGNIMGTQSRTTQTFAWLRLWTQNGYTSPFDGKLSEFILCNAELGASDAEGIRSYLLAKWGI